MNFLMGAGYKLSLDQAPQLAMYIMVGTALVAFWAWREPARPLAVQFSCAGLGALAVLAFGVFDWALLAALPRLGLSFGPVGPALLGISAIRLGILVMVLISLAAWRILPHASNPAPRIGWATLLLLNLVVLACEIDGLYVEPFDLRTTGLRLETPAGSRPLRIVHLSDTHVERITRREIEMLQRVRELQPDLILLTGDYLNIDYNTDPRAIQDGRSVLAQLSAPYGVYAIPGSPPVDLPQSLHQVFDGLDITLLQDEARQLDIAGQAIYLMGVSVGGERPDAATVRDLAGKTPPGSYSILLYHTPDMAEAAAQSGVDLYLAGHTHGGQVRLPGWGAIVTMSAYGKRFEAGQYQIEGTTLYVSRGIGMEGLRLPRVRFLCPPEIVFIQLEPGDTP